MTTVFIALLLIVLLGPHVYFLYHHVFHDKIEEYRDRIKVPCSVCSTVSIQSKRRIRNAIKVNSIRPLREDGNCSYCGASLWRAVQATSFGKEVLVAIRKQAEYRKIAEEFNADIEAEEEQRAQNTDEERLTSHSNPANVVYKLRTMG